MNPNNKNKEIINIALVGSGFSGSSVSYLLFKEFEKLKDTHALNITIFEKKSNSTDNNLRDVKIQERLVEVGIPFVYEWQTNLKKLINNFKWDLVKYNTTESIGIFDKSHFLIEEKNKDFMKKLKEIYPKDIEKLLALLKKFHKSLQMALTKSDNKHIFEDLEAFISTFKDEFPDFKDLDTEKADTYMDKLEISYDFITKIIRSILNANLMQHQGTTIFSSLITLLNQFNNKYTVEGGISQLLEALTYNTPNYQKNLFFRFNCEVKYVMNQNDRRSKSKKKYSIVYKEEGKNRFTTSEPFDIVILNNRIIKKEDFEIKDETIPEEIIKNLNRFESEYHKIYEHIFVGNLESNFFTRNEKEVETKDYFINNNKFSSELILANDDNRNETKILKEFSMITPICKYCYFNRNFESNNYLYNSIFRITSKTERQHLMFNKFLFTGDYYYEQWLGFERTRFRSMRHPGGLLHRQSKPKIILSEETLYNNRAFDFIDENLEFKLISSKNIAHLILKIYAKEEELDLLSMDF